MSGGIGRIDLGNHKRHLGIHSEGGGIIHHDGARPDGMGSKLFGDPSPGAEESDVDPGKTLRGKGLDGQLLAAEGHLLSRGTRRRQQAQGGDGKIATLQHTQHLDPHGTGRPHDGEMLRDGVSCEGGC